MIVAPSRRIWLYPVNEHHTLEVLILGEPEEIASVFARVKHLVESWIGFTAVRPIAMGLTLIGLRADLSIHAEHNDVIAEALRVLVPSMMIVWSEPTKIGTVGTW